MHFHIEPLPVHPPRVGHAILSVDHVEARDGVQDGAGGIERDGAPRVDHPLHILVGDLNVDIGDRDDPAVVPRFEVRAGDRDRGGEDLASGGALGLLDRRADRARRVGHMVDLAAVDARRRREAHAENLQRAVFVGFAHHGRNSAAAEVDGGDGLQF